MQLTLRAQRPGLTDTQVRKALLGLLDVGLLAAVGAGSDNTVTLAQAQVRTPSDPGYVPTAPPALDRNAAMDLLHQAGYNVESAVAPPSLPGTPPPPGHDRLVKDGTPLGLAIGVAANDPTSVAVANTAADQLRSVGIEATVLAMDPVALYADGLERVDAIVGWRHAGGDLATVLASRYGCPGLDATAVSTATTPAPTPQPTSTSKTVAPQPPTPSVTSTAPTIPLPKPLGGDQLVQAPSNLTGICDHAIQPKIDAALAGTEKIADVLNELEPKLWAMETVLPILQDTTIVAAGPTVQNVSLTGAVPVGIVGDAGKWVKGP